jgi:hypothetical protein
LDRSGRSRDGYNDFDDARLDRSGRNRDGYNDFDDARSDRSGRSRDGYNDFDDARSDRSGRSSSGGGDGSGVRSSGRHGHNGSSGYNGRGGYRDDDGDDASAGPFRDDSRSGRSGHRDSRSQGGSSRGGGRGSSNGSVGKGSGGKGDPRSYGEFADDDDRSSGGHRSGHSGHSGGGGSSSGAEGASLLAGAEGGDAVRLASPHSQGSPCGYLAVALLLVAAGVAGGQLFAASGAVRYPHLSTADAGAAGAAAPQAAGFTGLELAGLLAQTVLLPGGLCVLVFAASQATTHGAWTPRRKAGTFGGLAAGCAAGSAVALWASGAGADLAGCFSGPQLCAGSEAAQRGGASGFALFTGSAYALLGLLLALLFAALAAHALRPAQAPTKEPLRPPQDLEADAQSFSNRHVAHRRLAAWERRANAFAAVAALLLLVLPLAVVACAFVPSQLEQVDAWEVDRKAAVDFATGTDQGAEPAAGAAAGANAAATSDGGSVGDSGGASDAAAAAAASLAAVTFAGVGGLGGGAPLLTLRVSRFLSLTLTVDVALFYGALYLAAVGGALARIWPAAQACLAAPPARGLVLWHPASKPRAGPASSSGSPGGGEVLWKPSDGGLVGTGGVRLWAQGSNGGSCGDTLGGAALAVLWPPSVAATVGEWLLLLLLTALLVAEFSYWFLAVEFPCAAAAACAASGGRVPAAERLARALGQVGCCVMGLLVLPVARNSLLAPALGVSWDKALAAHNWLGYLFLGTALGHQAAWWAADRTRLGQAPGSTTSALFPFPLSAYDPNNWAVPLQVTAFSAPPSRLICRVFSLGFIFAFSRRF